jgi:aspartate racemase
MTMRNFSRATPGHSGSGACFASFNGMDTHSFHLPPLHGKLVGALGGMGPVASAHFLASLYRPDANGETAGEQELPRVTLISDPTMPDRTDLFLRGEVTEIVERTDRSCRILLDGGAEKIVLCCFTLHHILDRLSESVREAIIPLPDLGLSMVLETRRKTLVLCTKGTAKLGIFERSPLWVGAREWIVLPDEGDQRRIHDVIYRLKRNGDPEDAWNEVRPLAEKYGVEDFLVGCTEFHLLSELHLPNLRDPLLEISKAIRGERIVTERGVPAEEPRRWSELLSGSGEL